MRLLQLRLHWPGWGWCVGWARAAWHTVAHSTCAPHPPLAPRPLLYRRRPQVAACMGKEGDATPFTSVTVDNISAALHR